MFKIQYDCLDNRGFLETETIKCQELKEARRLLDEIRARKDIRGKPILSKV